MISKSAPKLIFIIALFLSMLSASSVMAHAIDYLELQQKVNDKVDRMTQSNETYRDNLNVIIDEIMRLQTRTYGSQYLDIDGPVLGSQVAEARFIADNATKTVSYALLGISNLKHDISSLNSEVLDLKSRLGDQEAESARLRNQLASLSTSQSTSLLTTLGNSFKTLGETLLTLAQSAPTTSNSGTSTTPASTPVSTTTPEPSSSSGTTGLLTFSSNQVSINRPSESGHDISAAFDGYASTYFAKQYSASYPMAMVIDMGSSKTLTQIKIQSRDLADKLTPKFLEVYTSTDGVSFARAITRSVSMVSSGGVATLNTESQIPAARYYQFNFIDGGAWDIHQLQFAEFQLYGY